MPSSRVKSSLPSLSATVFPPRRDMTPDNILGEDNSPSTAMRLSEMLRGMVLGGSIPPGARLDQRQLAKLLGTTTAPLREALSALESEGLLTRQQGLGVFSRIYTVLEIEELSEIRGMLEALAARRATQRISASEIEHLRDMCKALGNPFLTPENPEDFDKHIAFHNAIIDAAQSPRLKELLQFHYFIDRLLLNTVPQVWSIQLHDHSDIVEAIASRDAQRAELTMRIHIADTAITRFEALRKRFGEGHILPLAR